MMIRERGGKIQLVRTEYIPVAKDEAGKRIPGTGRGRQVIIGTFDRFRSAVSSVDSTLVEKLTADERKELEAWFAEKQQEERQRSLSLAPRRAVNAIKELADNFDQAPVTDEQIDAIKAAMSELLAARRTHKKRGR